MKELINKTDAIVISPETLSFNYLANSTILQFFLEAGVKLDLFFKLLWRHVFTVELLRNRYNLKTQRENLKFFGFDQVDICAGYPQGTRDQIFIAVG